LEKQATEKKDDLVQRYINTPAPKADCTAANSFTHEDGRRMTQLKQEIIPMKDTALGVAAKQNAKAVMMH
jgi:hypothetical protein